MGETREDWPNLPAMMLDRARAWADRPMLRHYRGGAWRRMRWGDFALAVTSVAAFLRARGVMPGDRVLIVSENRPEFPIADTAIMAIGAVSVPTYTTNTVADHAHILRDSGASAAIVSTRRLAERLLAAARQAGTPDGGGGGGDGPLALLLCCDGDPPPAAIAVHRWEEALAAPGDFHALEAEAALTPPTRLACLIYTSGTGGAPKGVMLPHRAMLANREGVRVLAERLRFEGERYLSFLPLSHSYEHTVGCFLLPSLGVEVVYSRGADRIAGELAEMQPAIITAVPRLFEVLRARMLAQLEKETPLRRRLFERTVALGLRRMDGPPLGLFERAQDAVLDRLVRDRVRARFGGRLMAMVSGGARLDPDLSGFFLALGLPVIQGYGQTEAGPVDRADALCAARADRGVHAAGRAAPARPGGGAAFGTGRDRPAAVAAGTGDRLAAPQSLADRPPDRRRCRALRPAAQPARRRLHRPGAARADRGRRAAPRHPGRAVAL